MIRTVPDDGIIAYNLTSNDAKPTEHLKTGSVIFEADTQDKYFFDEESKQWYKYTGPWLNFYTKIDEETYCFFGLAKDTKPEGFGIGSMFVEVDASKAYILSDDGWKEAENPGPTPPGPTPQPVLQDKTIDPAVTAQQVTYDSGYDGLGTVNITAVTNNIDANIKAENIKKDIAILGVTGTYEPATPSLQDKTVTPATIAQTVQPDEIYDGLHTVTVTAVTNSIDNNIQAANIKKDVTILGITGSYEPAAPVLQDKTVTPTTAKQVIYADEAYDGLDEVTVSAVTSSIDNNIQAANIKKNITILGVVGTYEGEEPQPVPTTTVDAVILLIDNLPASTTVVEKDRARIHSIRETYETLSSADKALVTNYSKLEACEAALPDEIIDLDFTDDAKVAEMGIDLTTHIIYHDPYYDILVHCDAIARINEQANSGLKYNSGNYFEVFNNSKKSVSITFTFVGNGSGKYFRYGEGESDIVTFDKNPIEYTITLASNDHIQFTSGGGAYFSKFYCII